MTEDKTMTNTLEKQTENNVQKAPEQQTLLFAPKVDILENQNEVVVFADMPGVDENSVNIDLEKNTLTISGEYNREDLSGFSTGNREFCTGNYERKFTLGNEIAQDSIKANVKNGVLKIILPKVKEAKARKITVKAG